MTTETKVEYAVLRRGELERPASIVGLYATSAVDWIERYVVTEAMIDLAVARRRRGGSPGSRSSIRRSIAIGIRCNAYHPEWWEAERPQNLRSDIMESIIIEGCPRDAVNIRGRGTAQNGAVDA